MSPLKTIDHLIDRYDVFLIDQFGTVHDGTKPYPGATEALLALRAAGKTVVILSNSGKSGTDNASRFLKLGFRPDSFDHFVTSGDVAVDLAQSGRLGFKPAPGTRAFTLSSGNDRNLSDRLQFTPVEDAADAGLIVISGSQADRIGLDAYETVLRPAAQANVPAICTNPDIRMITPEGLAPGAGSIARLYEAMGGTVHWVGKPHGPMYEYAHRLCGLPAKDRIVGIGDSLEHDIAGAASFGIDAVLVRRGVSADISRETLQAHAGAAGIKLTTIMDELA